MKDQVSKEFHNVQISNMTDYVLARAIEESIFGRNKQYRDEICYGYSET